MAFLVGDRASAITGSDHRIDGGTVRTVQRGPTMTEQEVIERSFDLAADPDLEASFSEFTDDVRGLTIRPAETDAE